MTCVGLGAALVVIGLALRAWFWGATPGGWFDVAPNAGVLYSPSGPDGGRIVGEALLWLGAIAAWMGLSLALLRTRRPAGQTAATAEPSATSEGS